MNSMYGKSLVVLTPLKQSSNHNIARIHREYEVIDSYNVLHVGAGSHVGIVVNKLMPANIEDFESDVALSFSVWLTNRKKDGNDQIEQVQEKRSLLFKLGADIELDHGRAVVHKFFKTLMSSFPTDYVSFMKKTMKLLQQDFPDISSIIIDYKIVEKHEQISIPDAAQYESESEVEEVTIGHVQEVLEHAYPNGLNLRFIAEALRCKEEEASAYLAELEEAGIATYLAESDEWLRNTSKSQPTTRNGIDHDQPTVAIITCLFVEKQAMDSLIEDSTSIHKYKTGGESNVYTLGRIGNHKVVATKLGLIGDSREAITSAGSITTRLLGNFQQIEHVFVVGVGGAVPHYTDERLHARLGDAVISASNPHAYVYAHELMFNRDTKRSNRLRNQKLGRSRQKYSKYRE
ncbi:unnamed protein product [Caenorhabditis auriculariae]|uniref:Winged helix-turn-helix domain-containing protein n=1 Tax=Caenorhabditis auriculariae TaxID=2777116 RepID=A0A8S1GX92_9PELO|nr:unnamed protein product [Caenorhabditis auriculariae]